MTQPRHIGKYQIRGVLGQGGVGTVYRAYQADLDREVAIKVMIAGEHGSPEMLKRFLREARSAAALSHPGIVPVYDVGNDGSLHFIVMELVEGRALSDLLKTGGLGASDALRLAAGIADALEEAHAKGLVHRDIKPSNILVDGRGRPRLADFGLAAALEGEERLTRTGDILGTPWYMSPEQAFGAPGEIDARTDVYSLGAVLYEMLVGRPPFDGIRSLQVLKKIEIEEPVPPSRRKPGLDPRLDGLVLRALEKDRSRRYGSAADFAGALRKALGAGPAAAGAPPKALVRVGVAVLVALAFGAGLLLSRPSAAPPPPPRSELPSSPTPSLELFQRGSVWQALRAAEAAPPALRLYLTFLRYELCQGNAGVSYLRTLRPLAVEKDVETLRAGGTPEDQALADLVSLALQRRYNEIAESGEDAEPASIRVVRAHAAFRRATGIRDDGLRDAKLKALAADLGTSKDRYLSFLAALAHARLGDQRRAEERIRTLMDRASTAYSDGYLLRAVVFDQLDLTERLMENLEMARAVDPEDPLPACYLLATRLGGLQDEKPIGNPFEEVSAPAVPDAPYPAPALLAAAGELFAGRLPEAERAFQAARGRYGDPRAWAESDEDGSARALAGLATHAGGKGPRFAYAAGLLLAKAGVPAAEAALKAAMARIEAPDAGQVYLLEPDELRDMRRSGYLELAAACVRRADRDEAIGHVGRALQAGTPTEDILEDDRLGAIRDDRRLQELLRKK